MPAINHANIIETPPKGAKLLTDFKPVNGVNSDKTIEYKEAQNNTIPIKSKIIILGEIGLVFVIMSKTIIPND